MTVVSFPSQLLHLYVVSPVERFTLAGVFYNLVIVAPIRLQAGDELAVDLRTGKIEIVERRQIVIWRSCWRN